jgi:hypothetical protein
VTLPMSFFVGCFIAAAVPFLIERFYFGKRFGPFAGLFRLFAGQAAILVVANGLIFLLVARDSPSWFVRLEAVVRMVTYLSIGIIPIMSLSAAVVALLIIAFEWLSRRKTKTDMRDS